MRSIELLAPIQIETTTGRKLPGKDTQFATVSQLDFARSMAGEPSFLGQRRGRSAARFQADALAELERAFGEKGEGMLRDDVADGLARAVEVSSLAIKIKVNAQGDIEDLGPACLWRLVPFMDAFANARPVAPVAAAPTVAETPRAKRASRKSL